MPRSAHAAAALLMLFALGARAEPRPIHEAEREAVAVAASFLSGGPAALWERLSPDAPFRALPRDEALAELAVRAGPHAGARWTLQTVTGGRAGDVAFRVTFPSGYEDGLLLRMQQRGAGWSLHELLTLADDPRPRAAPPPPEKQTPIPMLLLGAAIFLAILAALIVRRSRLLAAFGFAVAIAGIGIALFMPQRATPPRQLPFHELRSLLPLREALARGDDAHVPAGIPATAREVGILWVLQSGGAVKVPGTPTDPLGGLHTVKHTPLAELVRARLALAKGTTDDAAAAYRRALAIEPRRDDIAFEALSHVDDLRFDDSRDARLHYARALRATGPADAQRHLRTAWTLAPVTREELLREPRFLPLLRDVRTIAMISLYAAAEPVPRSANLGQTPVSLPPDAQAFVTGNFLGIAIRGASIHIPGGAALAPPNARAVAATHWKRQDDAAALRDAATLLELPVRARSTGGPSRLARAAEALAEHNRWPELVALTDDITPQTPSVSPRLLVLRMRALLRADRAADARALAEGAAVRDLIARARYPGTLLAIGDAIANTDRQAWDTTEKLYRAVTSVEQKDVVAARLRQLELRRALVTNGVTIATAHFDVRHDPSMNPAIASRIGDLLEAERARLLRKLPAARPRAAPRRVTVNVLYWDTFRDGITGTDHILGLYDGEILFPFGVVNQFKPEIVAIITHELTHALVAQATGDNAPRWFQEGLARRMEIVGQHENAFHETAPALVLPVPLLDAAMENSTDVTMIEQGYLVSQTFIRYLESRYGANAIGTLIAAFAAGKNTDDALSALTGTSLDALNREFREWGFANSGNFANDEPWPYRDLYSPGIDPRIKAGFKWSRRP